MNQTDGINSAEKNLRFLSGGGEMGSLMRSKKWHTTVLGNPATWPQSLRTTLSIILNSKFPMFLFWGEDHICFYNDAYRPSLGNNGKHPGILGMDGKAAWPEIWDFIYPIIEKVLAGEGASWYEDQLLPIYRNSKMEDVYWTFSYSPVTDEGGIIAGVFVTCTETTGKVINTKKLQESNDQFEFAIDAAEMGTFDYNPITNKFRANNRLKEWFGLQPEDEIELHHATNAISDFDRKRVIEAIQQAVDYTIHAPYNIEYTIIHPLTGKKRIVRAKGKAWFNGDRLAYRFNGTLTDETVRINALKEIQESEERFRNMSEKSSILIALGDETSNATYFSKAWVELTGRSMKDLLDFGWVDLVHPEDKERYVHIYLDAFKVKDSFTGEFRILNKEGEYRWLLANGTPRLLPDGSFEGYISTCTDITDFKRNTEVLKESEQRVRALVDSAPFPIGVYTGIEMKIALANQSIIDVWGKGNDVIGKLYTEILPELENQEIFGQLASVYNSGIPFYAKNQRVDIVTDGETKTYYFNYNFTPLYDAEGKIYGVMNTAADVTDLNLANKRIEESEAIYRNTQERLRLAIEATELGTWDLDLKTDDLAYSPRLAEIFGHDPVTDFHHSFVRNQIHPEDEYIVKKAFEEAMVTGNYFYKSRIVKPGKDIGWIRTQGKVLYDDENKPVKIIGTVRDITEEKEYQQELEEREEKFRLLAESLPQFIWTGDKDGNINYLNEAVYKYSGLSPDEIKKKGFLQIVHPDDRMENERLWADSIRTGRNFVFEHRFRRSDGEYRWQLSRAIPQRDAEGDIQMWVGSSTDIQEIKKQEEDKDFFISIASHELKTPVTSIKAYIQMLLMKYADSKDAFLEKSLFNVDRQIARLTTLISDMLDMSKLKSGTLYLEKDYFNLNVLIAEVIDEIRHINPSYNISYAKGEDVILHADRDRIGQVLTNFLTNAVKYSPLVTDIKVTNMTENNKITVSVEDSGIGINKADQEKIFARFYRVEGKNEKTFPGFGIGLFICKEIIQRHNGRIGVISEPGKGSVFYFTLPLEG